MEEEIKREREMLFLEHIRQINDADAAEREEHEVEMKKIRNPQRRHTDGLIGVKFRTAPFRTGIEGRLEKKDELLVRYEAQRYIDVPDFERDLHTSLIFDRAMEEDVVEKKRVLNIDPTDKRYVFENEINRFVKEQKQNEKEKMKHKENEFSRASAFSSYLDKPKGSEVSIPTIKDSKYSSSEDDSLYQVEEDMKLKRIVEQEDKVSISKSIHKKSNYGAVSNDSSINSADESDELFENNNEDNISGNLIKVSKPNKNFQMKLKQRHAKKILMTKKQKTKMSRLTIKKSMVQSSEVNVSQSKGMVDSKDTINSNLKKTTKKLLSLNSNKITHAVSSKFGILKQLENRDNGRNLNGLENSISVNSIDVSITKKKKPKDHSDYSFDFEDKNKDITKSRTKIRFEDEQLSRIEEINQKHESIMSDKFNQEDSDSEVDNEEKKDNVIALKAIIDDKNILSKYSKLNDSNDNTEQRPHSANQALVPPKTAMTKSQSLLNINPNFRPSSANVENHSEMIEERSVAGSIRSFMGKNQAKNYELLRQASRGSIASNSVLSDAGHRSVHGRENRLY